MKTLLSTLLILVGLLAVTPLALAQTPDGETPANEGVCDDLQGMTPGLYGLCVAFCEAQDHASLSSPITHEELLALEGIAPSGRILANYNKKKKDGDLDMPCILVQEPCPCWTADELASIDGQSTDGAAFWCSNLANSGDVRQFNEEQPQTTAIADLRQTSQGPHCVYNAPGTTFRFLSVNTNTLTIEQATTCLAQVNAACADAGDPVP